MKSPKNITPPSARRSSAPRRAVNVASILDPKPSRRIARSTGDVIAVPSSGALTPIRNRALASLLMERRSFGQDIGLQFDGRRDLYESLGYPRIIPVGLYRQLYKRGGIAKRIVNIFPKAVWAGGADIVEDPTINTDTPFEKAASELFEKYSLWSYVKRADILARIGRYAVLLIGAPGKFNEPLGTYNPSTPLYFVVAGEDRARIASVVQDKYDPRYNMPETYDIRIGASDDAKGVGASTNVLVHHSRVIHFAADCLEDDVYGTPILESVVNYFMDLDKNVGGGSEAAWKRMDPGMHVDIDPTMDYDEDDYDKLSDEITEFQDGMRRYLATTGTKVSTLSSNVFNFGPNATQVMQFIASTHGIPIRILMGSERGELASVQDRNNWGERIQEERRDNAKPQVFKLVDRLIGARLLPKPKKPRYDFIWPQVALLDDLSKSEIAKSMTAANRDQATVTGRVLFTTNEIRRDVYGYGPIEEQADIEAIRQVVEQPGKGKSSTPGGRSTDVPSDSSAPGEDIPAPTKGKG